MVGGLQVGCGVLYSGLYPVLVALAHTPPVVGLAMTRLVGLLLRDVVLTRDEVDGLTAGLLSSDAEPAGTTKLGDWLEDNGANLGQEYVSELIRNFQPTRYGA